MRHVKRFKNWLVVVYYACWKMSEQVSRDQQKNDQVDTSQPQASEVKLDDAPAELEAKTAAPPSEAVALVQQKSAPKKIETHSETAAVKDRVPKVTEVKQSSKPEQPVPQTPVAAPANSAAVVPPAAVKAKSQVTNGATHRKTTNGKYQPGAINDQTAQRLARLLVSEIKLYHKSKSEGEDSNQSNNIYDLLRDPIEKSRQHYKQRMGAQAIESMPDYFHGELVRALCGGDASRLGSNYPMDRS